MLILVAPELNTKSRIDSLRTWIKNTSPCGVLVESTQSRRDLSKAGYTGPVELYNEHNQGKRGVELEYLEKYKQLALVSDGGAPCIGDPGSSLVRLAHQKGRKVVVEGVNSYILSGLLLSGCSANQFQFLGYPPAKKKERRSFLEETLQSKLQMTQVFIETPYRFVSFLEDLTKVFFKKANKKSWMSVSIEIGSQKEQTFAGTKEFWNSLKNLPEQFGKKPLGIVCIEL